MRLTTTSYAVLGLVDLLGEATPYDLKRAIEQSIENFWPVPHTTFYVEPARLAKGGYLSERQEEGGRRRKHYAITELGREALTAWVETPEVAPPALHDEMLLKTFLGADSRALVGQRRAWHESKLAELEGYLRAHALAERAGVRQSLEAGIAYHRKLLEAIEDLEG